MMESLLAMGSSIRMIQFLVYSVALLGAGFYLRSGLSHLGLPMATEATEKPIEIEECSQLSQKAIQLALPTGDVISRDTRCPVSDAWLADYLHNYYHPTNSKSKSKSKKKEEFVFLNFGCNKGFDAVQVAADVSGDHQLFDKQKWYTHLEINTKAIRRPNGVCHQGEVDSNSNNTIHKKKKHSHDKPHKVQVHCVEAMPQTVSKLQHAATATKADKHGIHIHNYALVGNNAPSTILFPNPPGKGGVEHMGIGSCQEEKYKKHCKQVPAITIDNYVAQHVSTSTSTTRIPFVSIDVEGYDFTLMKAAPDTLQRTDYLEFEFHSHGDWANQTLHDATDMLEQFGFVCYWAGQNQLWRISSCWMDVYGSFHGWSNVACVNPLHQPGLAAKMEHVFEASQEAALLNIDIIDNNKPPRKKSNKNKNKSTATQQP
ncbi:expressed unknown protein [Seminavis robusta]|uniref:Methyltransferase FkbM domain-containing protein n=1 Tax=Seminavis robusta TaxID=568900 RepID=A0A9N8DBB3_9STRA|nr:expressed unknown protein [Seminavis robusta]|eukprot:Sro74_g040700.1 n/a (429) ;mRNA; r:41637-42923